MTKKVKGFTLVELLAIIVILAIIAVITVPIILNVIDNEYKATIENGEVTTVEKGSCTSTETSKFGGQVITEIPETGHTGVKAIVYLDPTNLSTECNAELAAANVNENGSPTGIKSGCMKWYAFKDENGYYTMLLDHNTTATIPWITQADYEQIGSQTATPSEVGLSYASENMTNGLPDGTWDFDDVNNRGPITLLNRLKSDTSNWVVAEDLTENNSYTAEWSSTRTYSPGNQKYTINYNGYKARVLSAEEINEITGKGTNTLSNIQSGHFDNDCSSYGTCSAGTNNYGWLFDYLGDYEYDDEYCIFYGCNACSNTDAWGYWTMSPRASGCSNAWNVFYNGYLGNDDVDNASRYGVRPVITVSKNKLGINS